MFYHLMKTTMLIDGLVCVGLAIVCSLELIEEFMAAYERKLG